MQTFLSDFMLKYTAYKQRKTVRAHMCHLKDDVAKYVNFYASVSSLLHCAGNITLACDRLVDGEVADYKAAIHDHLAEFHEWVIGEQIGIAFSRSPDDMANDAIEKLLQPVSAIDEQTMRVLALFTKINGAAKQLAKMQFNFLALDKPPVQRLVNDLFQKSEDIIEDWMKSMCDKIAKKAELVSDILWDHQWVW